MERTGETVKILAALLVRTTRIVLDEKKSCYYEGQWIPRNMITYEVRKYESTIVLPEVSYTCTCTTRYFRNTRVDRLLPSVRVLSYLKYNVPSYFSTFVVVSYYEGTKVQLCQLFRKYESTKVRKYFRTLYGCTKVRKYESTSVHIRV